MHKRYITASSDIAVEIVSSFGVQEALDFNQVKFCSDCGAIVYRTDLHDNWHKNIEQIARNAQGIKV